MIPAPARPGPVAVPPGGLSSARLIDQVEHLHAFAGTSLVGNLVGAVVVLALYRQVVPGWVELGWLGLFLLAWGARALLAWRFRPRPAQGEARLRRWRHAYVGTVLATGALWGLAVWVFYPQGQGVQRTALLLTVYSFCIAAVPALATRRMAFTGFIALAFVPTIVRVGLDPSGDGWVLSLVFVLIFGVSTMLGRSYQGAFDRVLTLKAEGTQLLAQLQAEKGAAEQARREAETANRAKTRFFAAASHDLRQPLHALGLFAEALRQRVGGADDEVSHLVNSINSSVDALEGLFSELLDITKIDSGAVEPRPEHFTCQAMFTRLKLHFEPTAFEKGLVLHFHGGRHVGHADPVLVERVIRNLLSNAIRYTNDGGVLVTARRRGERLLLQVWDTGVGIREHEQARIFDEFYQVAEDAPDLNPWQRKGLGLGLAIVQRLARVMDAPLGLRSVSGRGTVFSLQIPLGRAPRVASVEPPRSAGLGLSLGDRRIVIVEDDAAVREGLDVLLRSWGAQVLAFDSGRACEVWAAGAATGSGPRPDLLIVDHQLEPGMDGVQVITALRRAFGAGLPAVVVTGSVMHDHEAAAQAADFHLLLKPVVPHKLRAMIGFKLGQR